MLTLKQIKELYKRIKNELELVKERINKYYN